MIPHPLLSNEIKRERRLIREFKKSNLPLQIREVLDLVQKPCPWNMLKLHLLIKKAPEEMKKVLQEIYRANNYPAAQQIINNSKDSPIGDRILSLIEKP